MVVLDLVAPNPVVEATRSGWLIPALIIAVIVITALIIKKKNSKK